MPEPSLTQRQLRAQAVAPLFAELKKSGRSGSWLARQLQLDRQILNHYKNGWRTMPPGLFRTACAVLGCEDLVKNVELPVPKRGQRALRRRDKNAFKTS